MWEGRTAANCANWANWGGGELPRIARIGRIGEGSCRELRELGELGWSAQQGVDLSIDTLPGVGLLDPAAAGQAQALVERRVG